MNLTTYQMYKHLIESDNRYQHEGIMSKAGEQQQDPTKNDKPCVQDMVISDIQTRKQVGIERYGTVLQPFNGRSALWDAYQEALDLCQYLRQLIYEEENKPKDTWVHDLKRKLMWAKINAATENHMHDRMRIVADIMDVIEKELEKHDEG